jgi:hypothetical protein
MRRPLYVRASGKRSGRNRLAAGRARVTRKARTLSAAERTEVVKQMRADGRLGSEVR